jgi:hypothetical protein
MNRHQRRRAAAISRVSAGKKNRSFYELYLRHLPQVPIDAPLERGRVHHLCFHHDEWCRIFSTGNPADCNCDPVISRHAEPVRS